jgi:aminopeptidase N
VRFVYTDQDGGGYIPDVAPISFGNESAADGALGADSAAGITESLAKERATRVADLRYAVSFTIPADRAERVTGNATITFTLHDATKPLALDFQPNQAGALHQVDIGSTRIEVAPINGHILLPASALQAGTNTVSLAFDAGDAPLNRSDDFLYTLFVPARAHEAFPCFDQPDLKARWTLALDVPAGWETIANGVETARASTAGRTRLTFAETVPLSTYLFAFAAGTFFVEHAERNGRALRMVHRETDRQKVDRNRQAIFNLHVAALDWLEHYTGIAYPFGKVDFLLVPAFQFGGMEHPGAVFYNASALLLEESATQNDRLERAGLISHETGAHVVRQPGHHDVVYRCVDQRGLRELHGGEDRESVLPAREPRPAVPLCSLSARL